MPFSLQALLHACKCLKALQKGWLLSGAELICGTGHAFGSHWWQLFEFHLGNFKGIEETLNAEMTSLWVWRFESRAVSLCMT